MGKDLGHRLAHKARDIGRKAVAIGFAAPEQQTLVRAQPEVVHYELAVRHGHVLCQHAPGRIPQRLGRHDEIVDRHHARCNLAVQPAQITVAGQDQVIGLDPALTGLHGDLRAFLDVMNMRALMDAHTRRHRRTRQTKGEIQRMQMARAHVQQPALVGRRRT